MMHEDPPKAPNPIVVAVATAVATTVATKLADWAVEEVKKRVQPKAKKK